MITTCILYGVNYIIPNQSDLFISNLQQIHSHIHYLSLPSGHMPTCSVPEYCSRYSGIIFKRHTTKIISIGYSTSSSRTLSHAIGQIGSPTYSTYSNTKLGWNASILGVPDIVYAPGYWPT